MLPAGAQGLVAVPGVVSAEGVGNLVKQGIDAGGATVGGFRFPVGVHFDIGPVKDQAVAQGHFPFLHGQVAARHGFHFDIQ